MQFMICYKLVQVTSLALVPKLEIGPQIPGSDKKYKFKQIQTQKEKEHRTANKKLHWAELCCREAETLQQHSV